MEQKIGLVILLVVLVTGILRVYPQLSTELVSATIAMIVSLAILGGILLVLKPPFPWWLYAALVGALVGMPFIMSAVWGLGMPPPPRFLGMYIGELLKSLIFAASFAATYWLAQRLLR